eukprot:1138526-Pelagomonas_calceolata.AAC.2
MHPDTLSAVWPDSAFMAIWDDTVSPACGLCDAQDDVQDEHHVLFRCSHPNEEFFESFGAGKLGSVNTIAENIYISEGDSSKGKPSH